MSIRARAAPFWHAPSIPSAPEGTASPEQWSQTSARKKAEVTQCLYREYRAFFHNIFHDLCGKYPHRAPDDILRHTQTILGRILFIAFAEDRGLLPSNTLIRTADSRSVVKPEPIWNNFRVLFQWIEKGHEAEQIPAYPGGLFEANAKIDELDVADEICVAFKQFAKYDYLHDVSVDVLGHIFEQSISDLDELRKSTGIVAAGHEKISRRKAEGVFYTPPLMTRYIVDQTLGQVFADRWQALLATRKPQENEQEGADTWIQVYEAYREEIKKIRVLDLSCGAGAFLVTAYDVLAREYNRINEVLAQLSPNQTTPFDVTKTVLHNNLFGVDVNAESVEITKLSLWLKTAERGRKLTYLDSNIKWGNSIVQDPMVHSLAFDWTTGNHVRAIFDPPKAPEAAEINARWRDGFDVVIGNPPYVRHELLGNLKKHLGTTYRAYHGMADLFVYFFERGISVLKPGGHLGFIVANKWLRGGYAEPLRKLLATETTLESIVDFGHAPFFPDADAFPCIVTLRKQTPRTDTAAHHDIHVTMFPREELEATEIADYVVRHGYAVPQTRLGAAPWSLERPALDALMAKIRSRGIPLREFACVKPHYGIKTGCNEAFVVDRKTRDALVLADPACAAHLKPFVRGQDMARWAPQASALWMLYVPWDFDISQTPALLRHLETHRDVLEGRAEVKQGRFPWYALSRYAADYAFMFPAPKIMYADLAWRSEFCLDLEGNFASDLCFFLPTRDPWLLAVLNSPVMWAYLWRHVVHGKDEVLRLKNIYMEQMPIGEPSKEVRSLADAAVGRLMAITKENNSAQAAILDYLRMQYGVEAPGTKLSDVATLDSDAFVQEVVKRRPKSAGKLKATDVKTLREMYGDEALPMQLRRREALGLERQLDRWVNEAYGLTGDEVELFWASAPPRMPFTPQ